MRTFADIWRITDSIYGAFSQNESQILYTYANSCLNNSVYVEIGSYCGRSSSILGMLAKDKDCELYCIDSFITGAPNVEDVESVFHSNMQRSDTTYNLIKDRSDNAASTFTKDIDFLFIDGDHQYSGVKSDCDLWIPKVKQNAFILFHDYKSSWEGVKQAVDERTELKQIGVFDSLIVTQKI